jgi:hypothetical protein
MSLASAVRIAASSVRSSTGRGVQSPGGWRKSAATSIASVAEPPLPSTSSRPPAPKRSRSIAAAASSASRPPASVRSRSAITSSDFIRTEAATSATTASTSGAASPRNG